MPIPSGGSTSAIVFVGLFAAGAFVLALLGHDLVTAIGAPSQAALVFLMLAGRLELFTVLLLFHPDLWRPHGTKGILRRA